MREIKFRQYYEGDDDNNPEWSYFDLRNGKMVVDGGWKDPQQFTGLTDCHGVEIYEGDIISDGDKYVPDLEVVEWEEVTARFNFPEVMGGGFLLNESYEVIGNVWDNPELLK